MSIDRKHMEAIAAVLNALALVEGDTPHCALACEDAGVAYLLGCQLGLTPKEIAEQHRRIMDDLTREPNGSIVALAKESIQ